MADLTLAKNAALRRMLQALFPNVALSSAGVALLATQIDGLEKKRARMRGRIDHDLNGVDKVRAH